MKKKKKKNWENQKVLRQMHLNFPNIGFSTKVKSNAIQITNRILSKALALSQMALQIVERPGLPLNLSFIKCFLKNISNSRTLFKNLLKMGLGPSSNPGDSTKSCSGSVKVPIEPSKQKTSSVSFLRGMAPKFKNNKKNFKNRKLERQPKNLGEQPESLGKQLKIHGKQPEILGKQPELLSKQPEIVGKQPEIIGKQPEILGKQPKIFGKQPEAHGEQPEYLRKKNPGFLRKQPNSLEINPKSL